MVEISGIMFSTAECDAPCVIELLKERQFEKAEAHMLKLYSGGHGDIIWHFSVIRMARDPMIVSKEVESLMAILSRDKVCK